jgi:hypothetical protein
MPLLGAPCASPNTPKAVAKRYSKLEAKPDSEGLPKLGLGLGFCIFATALIKFKLLGRLTILRGLGWCDRWLLFLHP